MPNRPFALVRPFALAVLLAGAAAPHAIAQGAPPAASAAIRTIDVVVDRGYQPARIEIRAGERVRLRFVRRDYTPCTREVVFPSLGIRRELPTNDEVTIELPPLSPGEHAFHCGMNMIHGVLIVRPD